MSSVPDICEFLGEEPSSVHSVEELEDQWGGARIFFSRLTRDFRKRCHCPCEELPSVVHCVESCRQDSGARND